MVRVKRCFCLLAAVLVTIFLLHDEEIGHTRDRLAGHPPATLTRGKNSGESYPGIWVDPPGNLTNRINQFVRKIELIRHNIWKKRGECPWKDLDLSGEILILDPVQPYYLHNITRVAHVTTVFLGRQKQERRRPYWTSHEDFANLLSPVFYQWAADWQICDWIRIKGLVPEGWSYTADCSSEMSAAQHQVSLPAQLLNALPLYNSMYHDWYRPVLDVPPPYVTYLHIVQDAVVTEIGEVYLGRIKFTPYACTWKGPVMIRRDDYDGTTPHREVFTIAQVFGRQVYHRNIDQLPRIAAYLDFLARRPEIQVHIGVDKGRTTFELLRMLGIPPSRVLQNVVRAKVLYVPEGNPCGMVNVPNTQLLAAAYRRVMTQQYGQEDKNSVIYVNRTLERRHLEDNDAIADMVRRMAAQYNLTFEVFHDNPVPSIEEAMRMFRRAVLVVAPHGAGLFNLVFSRPGTYVLEVLCPVPWTIMCFQKLSHVLGHRYYGLRASGCSSMHINRQHFLQVLHFFLPQASLLAKSF